jgi:hypothetical protein
MRLGDVDGYVIGDTSGKMPILLPARASWQQGVRPVPGTRPMTPEEMAALVARRSGRAAQGEGTI